MHLSLFSAPLKNYAAARAKARAAPAAAKKAPASRTAKAKTPSVKKPVATPAKKTITDEDGNTKPKTTRSRAPRKSAATKADADS